MSVCLHFTQHLVKANLLELPLQFQRHRTCWLSGADGGQLMRTTWKYYRVTPLVLSANSYTFWCESCASFHTAGDDWQNSQCTQLVVCKCAQCRVCHDSSGHWCDTQENLKGCKGLSRGGIQSYTPVVMSAIKTTPQQLEVFPLIPKFNYQPTN